MKRLNLSISWLYFISALAVVLFIIVPIFVWSYYDTKEETQKNINNYFKQSKSIVEIVVESKADTLKTVLNSLCNGQTNQIEQKLERLKNENFDILFYRSNKNEIYDFSESFLFDTKKIVNEIVKIKDFDQKNILNITVDNRDVTLIYTSKKVVDRVSGQVKGDVLIGEFLNDNLSFLNKIIKKTALDNIALVYKNKQIVSNINNSSLLSNILNENLSYGKYKKIGDFLVYKDSLFLNGEAIGNEIILISDNKSLDALFKQFIEKNILTIVLILTIFYIGYKLTKKFIIMPIAKLKDFSVNALEDNPGTLVKEVNLIANNLFSILKSLDEYKKAIDSSSIVSKSDVKGNITYVNDKFCETTGYDKDEVLGKSHNILRDNNVPKSLFKNMWKIIKEDKKPFIGYLSNKKKNGELFYTKVTITPILDKNNDITEFLALRENITELVKSKEKLEHAYVTDKLTSLSNRYQLTMDLDKEEDLNLVLINIDSFSEVNDFYGNEIGDEVLILFSKRIKEYFCNPSYKIYRVYGDEFALTVKNGEIDIDRLLFAVNIFINHIEGTPFVIDEFSINLRISCGISLYEKNNTFVHADLALKSARKDKKDCEIYSSDNTVLKELKNNLYWTHEIKTALAEDRIEVFYQPIRNNKNGQIEKYESLVRLIKKDGEVVSPFFFLDISKKTKLYNQITKTVIEKSFNFFKDKPYSFSINLTIDDILNDELISYLKQKLKKYKFSNNVVLEIVESEQIENFDIVSKFIESFKSLGCQIAIDDFGTGYSNFEYLMKLKVDYIKIDGSLIKNILNDATSYSVVETIVSFAKKSNLKVIAEFVSSKEIQDMIQRLDIDHSQGFYWGRPQKSIYHED